MSPKLGRFIIAIIAAACLTASCGLAQEGPPPHDGWTSLHAYGTPVRIFRDGFGVPHIYADSKRALFFAFGYAVAQDRLAQLEFYRRAARGELAAIFGPGPSSDAPCAGSIVDDIQEDVLAADITMRELTYSEAERRQQFDGLNDEARALLGAYTDGVNRWIHEAEDDPAKTPAEFRRLAVKPQPWRVTDSIAIFHAAMHRFGLFGGKELRNTELLKTLGAEEFNAQYPINCPDSPTTISGPPARGKGARLDLPLYQRVTARAAERIEAKHARLQRVLGALGFPTKYGSFLALIGPKRSASRHTIFLSCPEMKFYKPAIVHEVALHGGGFHVAGMAFPGVPLVILGRNRSVVWGLTSGHADNVDVFAEELNPANHGQYRFRNRWLEFESREEVFEIKGSEPLRKALLRSIHGPLIECDDASHLAYTYQYTFWMKEYTMIEAFLQLARCTTPEQFRAACRKISVSFNLFYADVNGRIGFQFCGRYRIPADGVDVRLPVSGTGSQEWQGFVPFEALPHQFDPPKGYFANWNNKPSPSWDNGDNLPWTGYNTVYWITEIIDEHPKLRFETVQNIPRLIDTHGSYEQIVELSASGIRGHNILPPGQCGLLGPGGRTHPHANDQQRLADKWRHKEWPWAPSPNAWSDR